MTAVRLHADSVWRDIVHATRVLRRHPVSTATAIASLAIGIGLNAAVFSFANGVLWQRLPLADSDRLVIVGQVSPSSPDPSSLPSTAFLDLRRSSRTLDRIAAGAFRNVTFIEPGEPDLIACLGVTETYFDVLGLRPALGRAFASDDYDTSRAHWAQSTDRYTAPAPQRVILSHSLWLRQFLGDRDVVGKRAQLNGGTSVEIVGVMGPEMDALAGVAPGQCWFPEVADPREQSVVGIVTVIGRRSANTSLAEVNAEMDAIGRNYEPWFVSDGPATFRAISLLDRVVDRVRTPLVLLFGAVVCVLLVTCANVINLFMASTSSRRDELATRIALGASRTRLVRQTLMESCLISLAGGACGFLLSMWAVPALVAIAPRNVPRLAQVGVDWPTFSFALIVSAMVAVICGLLGSLPARKVRPTFGSVHGATTPAISLFRRALTVGEIALALMLVVGSTLMVRTIRSLNAIDLGFDPAQVVVADLSATRNAAFSDPREFQTAVVERVKSLPGVRAAGVGGGPLSRGGTFAGGLIVPGDSRDFGSVRVDPVSPGYFEALDARLLSGRFFDRTDTVGDASSVIMLNVAAARLFWRGADAIGKTVVFNRTDPHRVVGVVANLRTSPLEEAPGPTIYQLSNKSRNFGTSSMVIKVDGNPQALVPAIRSIIRSFSREQPFRGVTPLQNRIDGAMATRLFVLRVIGLFSVLGLILAVVGVYGVLAEFVSQRVPEIGLRMAFGATTSDILRPILGQGAWLAISGVALGIFGAVLLRNAMSTFVYGVETLDPLSYLTACVSLLAATAIACTAPARRASRLDPVAALRAE
jgi:predicted permease